MTFPWESLCWFDKSEIWRLIIYLLYLTVSIFKDIFLSEHTHFDDLTHSTRVFCLFEDVHNNFIIRFAKSWLQVTCCRTATNLALWPLLLATQKDCCGRSVWLSILNVFCKIHFFGKARIKQKLLWSLIDKKGDHLIQWTYMGAI